MKVLIVDVSLLVRNTLKRLFSRVNHGGIEILEVEIDDSWARDIGPIFVTDGREGVAGVHWRFNAWGNKYTGFDNDAAFGRTVVDALDMLRSVGLPAPA